MKRLFAFALVLSLLTVTVFAEEATSELNVGGNLTWGFVVDPDNEEYDDVLDWADIYFSGRMDDHNTFRVLLEFYGEMPEDVYVAEAEVTTDLARYLGLDVYGVSLDWRNGFGDAGPSVLSAGTRYGFDEVTDSDEMEIDTSWMSELTVGFNGLFRLKTAWGWDAGHGNDDIPDLMVEASTGFNGIYVSATYATNRTEGGAIGFSSKIVLGELVPALNETGLSFDLGASVAHNVADQDAYDASTQGVSSIRPEQTVWGMSARAGYLGADLGVSYKGGVEDDENAAFGWALIGLDAGYRITNDLGVFAGIALDFTDYEAVDPTMENIDGVAGGEVGTSLDIGATNFKTGYWFTDGYGAGSLDALGANQDGGIFFRFTHSWGGA